MRWKDSEEDQKKAGLIKRAKANKELEKAKRLWAELSNKHRPRLYKLAQKWISRSNLKGFFEANDTVHGALLKVYDKIHTYDETMPFDRWLDKVALYCHFDMFRDFYHAKGRKLKDDENNSFAKSAMKQIKQNSFKKKENTDSQAAALADIDKLRNHFNTMGMLDCFDILVLAGIQEMSNREIAIFLEELKPSEKIEKNINSATERIRYRRKSCEEEAQKFLIDK